MIDTLHPHQIKTLESLREALRSGSRRPMVQAPTGAGKTVLAAAIVEGALSKGKRVIYLVPFLGLVDQTLSAFHRQGITSVGVIQGYHPATDASQPVQIASSQTLQRRALPPADLVLVDANPMSIEASELSEISVVMTMLDGRPVYRRGARDQ